jgi:outer membrane protein assembly factor BamB
MTLQKLIATSLLFVLLVSTVTNAGAAVQTEPSPGDIDWTQKDLSSIDGLELGTERVYAIRERSVIAFDRESGDVEWLRQVVPNNRSLSGPIATVAHGQLVVAGGYDSPTVVGVNATDGTVEWRRGVARPNTDIVAVDGGFVLPVAPDYEEQLLALTPDGDVLWRNGNLSYVQNLASTDQRVIVAAYRTRAHRASDGCTTWVSDGTPGYVTVADGSVYAYVEEDSYRNIPPRTVAYDLMTGAPTTTGNATEDTFSIDAYASRGTTLAIYLDRYGEPEPPRLQVMDMAEGEIRINRTITELSVGPAVGEKAVYMATDDTLTAYDTMTGEERWETTVGDDVDIVVTDGNGVFVATYDGIARIHTLSGDNGDVDIPPVLGEDPPTDPDNDGRYEDINGNGVVTLADVTALFANRESSAVTGSPSAFDFNENGRFSLADVTRLFEEL